MEVTTTYRTMSVRLPEQTYRKVEEYVNHGGAINIAEFIRTSVELRLKEVVC